MRQPNIVVVGSLNMDIVVKAERAPEMGETLLGQEVHFIPGGKGANQAVAAARLGANVFMLGAVGDDAFGLELRQSLEQNGVNAAAVRIAAGESSGIASILLVQGDNQIVVVPGANASCTPEDVYIHEELFAQADVVLLQLEIPVESAAAAAELAHKYGKAVILNPAPAQSLPEKLLENTDYITPNRSELGLLTGLEVSGAAWKSAAEQLVRMGPGQAVVTLGSEGAAYMTGAGTMEKKSAYRVSAVDTTGAGDTFNGGLAYALGSGAGLGEAVSFAVAASALSVTKLGAQTGMPTYEEVMKFMHKEKEVIE
ncbi:ribokinase [Paenibacillus woosongensis]|uniref:Ribokinase n=1 Tax=Paenibacillus woosongensis TaxID=307580 RepID=A0A7X3CL66_9BACL|nr:ribokinase [Paenibacillus woosongensis]MUG44068.1 ribokinase [Paenibacillus woosongensis]